MSDHKLGKRCCGTLGRALLKVRNSMNSLYIFGEEGAHDEKFSRGDH